MHALSHQLALERGHQHRAEAARRVVARRAGAAARAEARARRAVARAARAQEALRSLPR